MKHSSFHWADLGSPLPSSPGLGVFHPDFHLRPLSTPYRTSTSLNVTPLNSTHLTSLFDPPRPPFGTPLGAQIVPRSVQDRPKSPLDTSFFQKHEFARNIGRRTVWGVSRVPRRAPRRPKMGSRRPQDDLEELLFSSLFLSSILVPLGPMFASSWPPFWDPNQHRIDPPRGTQDIVFVQNGPCRPKTPQEPSKTLQDPPRTPKYPPRPPSDP